jgi:hypothetical protein
LKDKNNKEEGKLEIIKKSDNKEEVRKEVISDG